MKKTLIGFLFLINSSAFSQTEKVIGTNDGLEISYKYQKIEENEKKDKYMVYVSAVNKNNYPLYYGVKTARGTNGTVTIDALAQNSAAKIVVRNSVGFLASDEVKVTGDQTNLFANNQQTALFMYEAGRNYNYEHSFNVKHGDSLIITLTYNYPMKRIENFDVDVTNAALEGMYRTSCGGATFSLALQTDIASNRTFLIQTVNGRQIKWFKSSNFTFVRDFDSFTTITYDKISGIFYYSNMDGTNCEWIKNR